MTPTDGHRSRLPNSPAARRRRMIAGVIAVLIIMVGAIALTAVLTSGDPGAGEKVHVPKDLGEQTGGAAPPKCQDGVVQIEAHTDASGYNAETDPQLSFTVTNTGEEACYFDLGTAEQKFVITTGETVVWRSDDCQVEGDQRPIVLQPEKSLNSAVLKWDRTHSSPETCDAESRESAQAGGASYHLSVEVSGVKSKSTAQFQLN